ncbi:sugar phosphate isomerase/epimerase [uncultured Anaerotruncus sp.]|uniref:sugar phosphate isomerase/epimerase family protein n=1 Tax=uncultured Anaerotruncus sp. TaxID=905011 RepID=UPI00280AD233|nr:sugar phosphate isomerase/epimerase [uncultured Anaerotruncus sp.]
MKIGVLTVPLYQMELKDALAYLKGLGVEAVELGTGGFSGNTHCDPEKLLSDRDALARFRETIAESGLEISGFSCHGNPVHPIGEIARRAHREYLRTLELAEEMGVDRVVTFSGCPGDSPGSRCPNWVTCPWPEDYSRLLAYQWEEVLIPYWREAAGLAARAGVKVCLEMHPGFCVYNPETLLKLRAAAGEEICANVDPSHLFWQGIDPVLAIRRLGDAVQYVHVKDVRVDPFNRAENGVLDTKEYGRFQSRSWTFRTVGYGHDACTWSNIVSELRMAGFDGVLSIEHEDGLLSVREGLEKAVAFTKSVAVGAPAAEMWWA